MRIVWMGAGEIGIPSLKWLLDEPGLDVVGVFTQPDRPVGRKQALRPTAIKTLALGQGIPVFQPESWKKDPEALDDLEALKPDLIVVMAYGCLLPKRVAEAASIACVNLHASLLPRHRGASPIQAAIQAGDRESGITVMHIAPELDAGDMIWKEKLVIEPDETGGTLHDKLAELGPTALAAAIPQILGGTAARDQQDDAQATHSGKLSRDNGWIDWSRPAAEIERQIRAFDPWPGTGTLVPLADGNKHRLKVFPPVAIEAEGVDVPEPGTVLDSGNPLEQGLRVTTGDGVLQLFQLQLEGRSRMDAALLLRGCSIPPGTCLGID